MSNTQTYFSVAAGVMHLVGFVPYILAIFRGETKPSKATWIIWGSVDVILAAGMYAADTLNGQIIGALIGVGVVVVLATLYGAPGWAQIDKVCLVGAAFGIVLWVLFKDPVLGILTCCAVLLIGAIPTLTSAWHYPDREDKIAWSIFVASGVCAVAAIPALTLADTAQPFTFFITDVTILALILIPRKRLIA